MSLASNATSTSEKSLACSTSSSHSKRSSPTCAGTDRFPAPSRRPYRMSGACAATKRSRSNPGLRPRVSCPSRGLREVPRNRRPLSDDRGAENRGNLQWSGVAIRLDRRQHNRSGRRRQGQPPGTRDGLLLAVSRDGRHDMLGERAATATSKQASRGRSSTRERPLTAPTAILAPPSTAQAHARRAIAVPV